MLRKILTFSFLKFRRKKVYHDGMSDLHRKYILKIMKKNLVIVKAKKWNSPERGELNVKYTEECIDLLETMVNAAARPDKKIDKLVLYSGDDIVDTFEKTQEPKLEGI